MITSSAYRPFPRSQARMELEPRMVRKARLELEARIELEASKELKARQELEGFVHSVHKTSRVYWQSRKTLMA